MALKLTDRSFSPLSASSSPLPLSIKGPDALSSLPPYPRSLPLSPLPAPSPEPRPARRRSSPSCLAIRRSVAGDVPKPRLSPAEPSRALAVRRRPRRARTMPPCLATVRHRPCV
jgi:hypothetical protein